MIEDFKKILMEKKFWIFAVLIVLIAVAIFNLQAYKAPMVPFGLGKTPPPKLKVARVEPLPGQKDVSTAPTIKIYFDRSITDLPVEIVTKPDFGIKSNLSPEGFNASLVPKATLKTSTEYIIEVQLKNQTIYSWSFATGKASTPAAAVEKIKAQLPFKGNHFGISYWSSTDKFFVTIDAKPFAAYKKAALDWFKARGLENPEKQVNLVFIPVGEAADNP